MDVSYEQEMTDVKDALNVNHMDDSPEQEMRYAITYVSNEQNVAREMDMQENHSLQCDAGMFSTSNYYLHRSNEPLEAGADAEKLCKDWKSKSNCGNNQHGVDTEK